MTARIAIAGVAILAAIGAWTALASHLFVWMGGLSAHFPSPWVTWWRYAKQPRIDSSTLFYLIASGVVAALPILMIAAVVIYGTIQLLRRSGRQSLYGDTGFASPPEMQSGGITNKRNPFR